MATAISIVLIITALFMIVTVLLQSSDEDGIGALSGRSDSYFSKTKAKTFEAKIRDRLMPDGDFSIRN